MITIDKIVEKAVPMAQMARYEMGANGWLREHTLRFVVHPDTLLKMKEELMVYWPTVQWEVSTVTGEVKASRPAAPSTDHIWGIQLMTDEAVPAGEVELRALVARSWK